MNPEQLRPHDGPPRERIAQDPTYHGSVTNPPTEHPEEQQWQQPSFVPRQEQTPVVSGQVLVPREQLPPPSAVENVVSTLAGLVWPVMVAIGIFTGFPFWTALIIAFVASAVLGAVKRQLRSQRRAAIQPPPSAYR